jgi:prephenate dehydratase
MAVSIAHLGPPGTYAEVAALVAAHGLNQATGQDTLLCPYPSIAQTLKAVAQGQAQWAVVPVENSIEGGVTMTLDALWQLDQLHIQQGLVLPITHALISRAVDICAIQTVYSHPQGLAQCQLWLEKSLPTAQLIATNSTTEGLQHLDRDRTSAVISSQRAAELHNLPILAYPINDHPDNCTRFLIMSREPSPGGRHTSLAFSVKANQPGVLVKPLQIFAERNINLSRIESRPTKRSLGDYVFFLDLEADRRDPITQTALTELATCTEILKIFGSYDMLPKLDTSDSPH